MGKCVKCGRQTTGSYSYCYAHWIEHSKGMSRQVGRKSCPSCGASITKDRSICWRCRMKKKSSWWPF